ncbi:hypothetical protein K1719_004240 [Acacia pycnantha]|nr:hypothetical protein K1719_004240 [Acacia pycnantha]
MFELDKSYDDYLVDAFMEQYKCGYKVNGSFTCIAYDDIVKDTSALLGIEMDKDIIKNRWKTFDNSTTQENSPRVVSGSSRKKQKVTWLSFGMSRMKVAQAINVGNQAMIAGNEALKEANEIGRKTCRNLPQLSSE